LKNKKSSLQNLSSDDQYHIGYMEGIRIGMIRSTREYLIRALKMDGGKPSRQLLCKINREADRKLLFSMFLEVAQNRISPTEFEKVYDTYNLRKT
jgi:hypothetical protein